MVRINKEETNSVEETMLMQSSNETDYIQPVQTTETKHKSLSDSNKEVKDPQPVTHHQHKSDPQPKLSKKYKIAAAKRARNLGKAYETFSGKPMPDREQRPSCPPTCRLRCAKRLSETTRVKLFREFWSLGDHKIQWDFIARNVSIGPTVKCSTRERVGTSRRANTLVYGFVEDETREQVCKTMFLNTLGISNAWVSTVCKKLRANDGRVGEDCRGKIGHRRKKVYEPV